MKLQAPVLIGILALALGVTGCDLFEKQEEEAVDPVDPTVEIQQRIDAFKQEAETRAVSIRNIPVRIVTRERLFRDGEELCGLTVIGVLELQIAINDNCWWDRSSYDREILIFHELGHAVLSRGHRDDDLPNGIRASIMNGGRIIGLYTSSTLDRRPYYIDELFDPETPVPAWGSN